MQEVLRRKHPGAPRKGFAAEAVREIEELDLDNLLEEGSARDQKPLKKLRARHHTVAKMLAAGRSMVEVAAVTGMTTVRIAQLQKDATFKELLELYADKFEEPYRELHEQLARVASDAIAEIEQRLEEEPDKVSIGQLLEISKMGADRTGFGPTSTETKNVNVNVGMAERLQAARERVRQNRQGLLEGPVVEAEILSEEKAK